MLQATKKYYDRGENEMFKCWRKIFSSFIYLTQLKQTPLKFPLERVVVVRCDNRTSKTLPCSNREIKMNSWIFEQKKSSNNIISEMDETFLAHIYKFNFCAEFNVPHYENDMLFYHLNEIWYSWIMKMFKVLQHCGICDDDGAHWNWK